MSAALDTLLAAVDGLADPVEKRRVTAALRGMAGDRVRVSLAALDRLDRLAFARRLVASGASPAQVCARLQTAHGISARQAWRDLAELMRQD